jgi:hypothetical protein
MVLSSETLELPTDLVELIEGCPAGWIATSRAVGAPEAARLMGASPGHARGSITVFLPTEQSGKTLENLRAHPRASVFFGDVQTLRTAQIKCDVLSIRPSRREDRNVQASYLRVFADSCVEVGIPREISMRMTLWPSVVVELRARELWVQTPGRQAGQPWG